MGARTHRRGRYTIVAFPTNAEGRDLVMTLARKNGRHFGIVPAAGRSERMGTSKLLLAWRGQRVIEHVLSAWTRSQVDRTVVVIRKGDDELASVCARWPIDLVFPEVDPVDMKASVQSALRHLESAYVPCEEDRWLLAPADMPRLTAALIDQLIDVARSRDGIVIPAARGRRGHPVAFPWRMSYRVFELGDTAGINCLTQAAQTCEILDPSESMFEDLDTPSDYQRLIEDGDLD